MSLRAAGRLARRPPPPPALSARGLRLGLGYVPQSAATVAITPITPRAKPPPFFFTGKPNLYALYGRLTDTLCAAERRFAAERLWPPPEGMPAMGRISWKWKNQEEMLEIANVTVMTKTEYDKLRRILVRLTAMRHFAHVVGDGRTVQDLTALLLPFEKVASGASSRLVRSLEIGADAADASGGGDASRGGTATSRGPTANQTLDAFGRSYTSGTRKEASARVYLIPVGAVASALDAVAAARSYRAFLAAERAKDEAQFAERRAAQASGAERMAPTWLAADARQGAELAASNAERKKLGLELAVVPPALAVDANGRLRSPFRAAAEPAPSKRSATDDLTDADAAAVEAEHDRLASAEVARPVVPLALTGPTPPAPSPTNSNAPSSSTERDGTLHFPSGTVAPPNSDPLLGSILINNVPLHRYFSSPKDREAVLRPFVLSRTTGAFNVFATVKQGGTTGQAEALALAIGRGIAVHQPMAKRTLAKWGLSADTRQVERKKTGRPKARKANTWVKR